MCFINACVEYAKPAHELAALGVGVAHGNHVLLWISSYLDSATRLVNDDCAAS
jgi:hypothetical protein